MSSLTRTALAIDQELLDRFDRWMTTRGYTSRSEAVRDLMRAALVEAEWESPSARVVATLSIIYDHGRHELAQQLARLQHADYSVVLCSQHVHLDEHSCLEVILLRGTARQLRRVADVISATRDVRAGKLTLLSQKV